MANPFYIKQIPLNAPFCNRVQEIETLCRLAESKNNVVIHSPRRFGKTSLVARVQQRMSERGAVTVYADLFGIGSVDEAASRIAMALFAVTHRSEPLWKKALKTLTAFRPVLRPTPEGELEITAEPSSAGRSGIPLLRDTVQSLGSFIRDSEQLVQITLDEFQEIVVLPDAPEVEAALRSELQQHPCSYFFVGSRRRLLLGMERQRPFFQSAFDFPLAPLPAGELSEFLADQFEAHGKRCGRGEALEMVGRVQGHPYYCQKLAHFVFENVEDDVTPEAVKHGLTALLSSERVVFEAILQGLSLQQRLFLRALAKEPTKHPFATGYARTHRLGSLKSIQHSVKQLDLLDLIERDGADMLRVIDPIFAEWLRRDQRV